MKNNGFDEHAEKYDAWFMENRNVLESELALLAYFLKNTGRTLSVGCGSGLFEMLLRQQYHIEITDGIEPSEGMAEIARKRGMRVLTESAEKTSFNDESWDTLIYNGTPGYIKDLESAFREACRILVPGGTLLVLDVPKESSYGMLYNLAVVLGNWDHPKLDGVKPKTPYPIEFAAAANWRTTAEKVELLKMTGFTDFHYAQTLTRHPLFSNDSVEAPVDGCDRGDYVAIQARKAKCN
ncbi:MAG: class I SAM-dependent methyltransferase [candidate division KSB1 bacterium]|nr:class I SAM-dependent methyltransferase [candidate division KSB1 bacterium]